MTMPIRVLLVEDERHIRFLVGSILRQKAYEVVEADSGLSALQALEQHAPFDLIITDLHMPELSGVELLKVLNRSYSQIPVIVISAYTTSDWARDALDNVAVTLPKPFSHAQLVNAVQSVVEQPSG